MSSQSGTMVREAWGRSGTRRWRAASWQRASAGSTACRPPAPPSLPPTGAARLRTCGPTASLPTLHYPPAPAPAPSALPLPTTPCPAYPGEGAAGQRGWQVRRQRVPVQPLCIVAQPSVEHPHCVVLESGERGGHRREGRVKGRQAATGGGGRAEATRQCSCAAGCTPLLPCTPTCRP